MAASLDAVLAYIDVRVFVRMDVVVVLLDVYQLLPVATSPPGRSDHSQPCCRIWKRRDHTEAMPM